MIIPLYGYSKVWASMIIPYGTVRYNIYDLTYYVYCTAH